MLQKTINILKDKRYQIESIIAITCILVRLFTFRSYPTLTSIINIYLFIYTLDCIWYFLKHQNQSLDKKLDEELKKKDKLKIDKVFSNKSNFKIEKSPNKKIIYFDKF